jgi:hypothetical protein
VVTLTYKGTVLGLPLKVEDGVAWIRARDLTLMGHTVTWDAPARIVEIDLP